ncbi:hypothetical protein ACDT12_13735, partial [Staphylococcus aureus]
MTISFFSSIVFFSPSCLFGSRGRGFLISKMGAVGVVNFVLGAKKLSLDVGVPLYNYDRSSHPVFSMTVPAVEFFSARSKFLEQQNQSTN